MRCFAFIFYVFRRSRRSCPTGNSRPLNGEIPTLRYSLAFIVYIHGLPANQSWFPLVCCWHDIVSAGRQVGNSAGRHVAGRQVSRSASRHTGRLASRQVGRLAARHVSRSASRQVGRQVSRSAGWQVGRPPGRQVGRSAGRQVGESAGRQVGRSARLSQAKDRDKSGPESLREFQEKIKRRFAKRCARVRRSGRGGRGWGE